MFDKNHYLVTVDLHIRAKIPTEAYTEDEAYENVQNDFDNSSLEEFFENYDWDVSRDGFEMDYADVQDEPW